MPQFKGSLRVLLALVAVAAADLAWLRWFVANRRSMFGFQPIGLDFGFVTMASILLVLAAHIAHRRGRVAAFAWGFAAVGLTGLSAYGALCLVAPGAMGRVAERMYYLCGGAGVEEALEPILQRYLPSIGLTYPEMLWVTVVLTAPQLLLAIAGGLSFRRIGARSRPCPGNRAGEPAHDPGRH